MTRIEEKFTELRERKRAALMPFITAGDPSYTATRRLVLEFDRRGADLMEIGVPFSDPIADGPTIQQSFTRALRHGASIRQLFQLGRAIRRDSDIPMTTMVSFSLVFKYGREKFLRAAKAAGYDGAIIPDLPVEEAHDVVAIGKRLDFNIIFLVTPNSTPTRQRLVTRLSSGFIYYVSVVGITGMRDRMPADMKEHIAALRRLTTTPICLGFGVSTPAHAAQVARVADGVIAGSVLVKEINRGGSLAAIVKRAGNRVAGLARGAKSASG